MRKAFLCRTFLLILVLLVSASGLFAQGKFIPKRERDQRIEEIKQLGRQLLAEPDTFKRAKIRALMVKKDVIYDDEDRPRGDGFAVPAFKELYENASEDLNARLQAVIGLATLKSPDANAPLITALRDKNAAIQLLAIQSLEVKRVKTAGKGLIRLLRSRDTNIVAAAAGCLAAIGHDENDQAAKVMVRLMTRHLQRLRNTPTTQEAKRAEHERVIEVLGRSCGTLIDGLDWAPGQTMKDLEREVNKFMKWLESKGG